MFTFRLFVTFVHFLCSNVVLATCSELAPDFRFPRLVVGPRVGCSQTLVKIKAES